MERHVIRISLFVLGEDNTFVGSIRWPSATEKSTGFLEKFIEDLQENYLRLDMANIIKGLEVHFQVKR